MDPIPAWVRRLWDVWDVRMLVVFSLIIQTILFMLGNRRKYISKIWIHIIVWLAYLVADWLATVALGKLSDIETDAKNSNIELGGIWAPLLLLHLGGPDTITAFSVDDNQLWLRHFLGLFVQLIVAIYVSLMSFNGNSSWFLYLAFPVFVAGIIKYGERTWVLKSACDTQQATPFANILKEVVLKRLVSPDARVLSKLLLSSYPDAEVLIWANQMVDVYKPHIENYSASKEDVIAHELVLKRKEDGLKYLEAIDVEMGLMYDLVYTKAVITYTKRGCILRSISVSCTVSVVVGFFYLIIMTSTSHSKNHEKHHISSVTADIIITCALLVGAFVLEMYGIFQVLSSDWTVIWLITQYPQYHQFAAQMFKIFPCLLSKDKQKRRRWSNLMGQFNLLTFSLKEKDKNPMKLSRRIIKFFRIEKKLDKYMHETNEVVPEFLKENIARFILSGNLDFTRKSDKDALDHDESKGVTKLDFDEKIIIWHIATKVCYHHHQDSNTTTGASNSNTSSSTETDHQIKETCKLISDYMVYLVVMCPFILPIQKDDVTFRNAVETLKAFFEQTPASGEHGAYEEFEKTEVQDNILIGKAQALIRKLMEKRNDTKWRILNYVWMEIICHAAKESQQSNHVRGLGRGGELLTWVWLFLTQSVKSGKLEENKKYLQVWDYEEEFNRWNSYISIFLNAVEGQVNKP